MPVVADTRGLALHCIETSASLHIYNGIGLLLNLGVTFPSYYTALTDFQQDGKAIPNGNTLTSS